MAEYLTIARPYTRAIYAEAKVDNAIPEWQTVLQCFAFIASDPTIKQLIVNPKVTQKTLIEIFFNVTETVAEIELKKIKTKLNNFMELLSQQKRFITLPSIAEQYHRMVAEKAGVVEVNVTSATILDKEQQIKLKKALVKRFESEITVDYKLDKSLIGGVLVHANNWVIDGTVKGKLARLKETL